MADGLDGMIKRIEELRRRLEAIEGEHSVPQDEMFPKAFMEANTRFSSFKDLLAASGYKVESPEDLATIPDDPWDDFIAENTRFESWKVMREFAGAEWIRRQLEF